MEHIESLESHMTESKPTVGKKRKAPSTTGTDPAKPTKPVNSSNTVFAVWSRRNKDKELEKYYQHAKCLVKGADSLDQEKKKTVPAETEALSETKKEALRVEWNICQEEHEIKTKEHDERMEIYVKEHGEEPKKARTGPKEAKQSLKAVKDAYKRNVDMQSFWNAIVHTEFDRVTELKRIQDEYIKESYENLNNTFVGLMNKAMGEKEDAVDA
jgi:hypothetical protein